MAKRTRSVLMQDLMAEMAEEGDAYWRYRDLAQDAEDLGMYDVATKLMNIAEDERRHNLVLGEILSAAPSRKQLPGRPSWAEEPYSWEITNLATEERWASPAGYPTILEAEGGGRNYIAYELAKEYAPKGYLLRVLDRHGEAVHSISPAPQERPGVPFRPFPQTFGDWVDLAEDIKEKDPSLAPEVNENLGYIFTEDPAQSEDAKRWLVEQAGKLGIT